MKTETPKLTTQEVFDKVKKHLLTQNAQALAPDKKSCLYLAADGKRCAAGCLIEKEYYTPEIEGKNVEVGSVRDMLTNSGVSINDIVLVRDLQYLHDEENVENWPAALEDIRIKYSLDWVPIA